MMRVSLRATVQLSGDPRKLIHTWQRRRVRGGRERERERERERRGRKRRREERYKIKLSYI